MTVKREAERDVNHPPVFDREIDIWRAASALMSEFGDRAAGIALERVAHYLRAGDDMAVHQWNRIRRAVRELSRQDRREDEALN